MGKDKRAKALKLEKFLCGSPKSQVLYLQGNLVCPSPKIVPGRIFSCCHLLVSPSFLPGFFI
jgi:hypothetical protein